MHEIYRFENGNVYEYSPEQHAYIFIGKLKGRTEEEFILDYEGRYNVNSI